VIADLAKPYRRPHQRWACERRVARGLLAALAVAIALVVLLGTVAHGGTSGGGPERVTVRAGDTLWSIAAAHSQGGDVRDVVDAIAAANHVEGGVIQPGQVLIVPAR
jgi:nucleoid-associated protein YgaU